MPQSYSDSVVVRMKQPEIELFLCIGTIWPPNCNGQFTADEMLRVLIGLRGASLFWGPPPSKKLLASHPTIPRSLSKSPAMGVRRTPKV